MHVTMQAVATRMARELKLLQSEPPPGVWAGPKGDSVTELEAQIQVITGADVLGLLSGRDGHCNASPIHGLAAWLTGPC